LRARWKGSHQDIDRVDDCDNRRTNKVSSYHIFIMRLIKHMTFQELYHYLFTHTEPSLREHVSQSHYRLKRGAPR